MNPQPKPVKEKRKRHKQTIACDISQNVRNHVYARDNGASIISGSHDRLEMAHYIPRSQGGMGIPENLVLLTKHEHIAYDEGNPTEQMVIGERIEAYLRSHYPNWDRSKLIYDKWKDLDPNWLF